MRIPVGGVTSDGSSCTAVSIRHRAAIQQSVSGEGGGRGVPHCGSQSKWGEAAADAHYCSSRRWRRTVGPNCPARRGRATRAATEADQAEPSQPHDGTFSFSTSKIDTELGRRPRSTRRAANRRRASTPGAAGAASLAGAAGRRKLRVSGFGLNGFARTLLLSSPRPPALRRRYHSSITRSRVGTAALF